MQLVAFVIAVSMFFISQQGFASEVDIKIQLISAQELEVSYTLPATCSSLSFLNAETLPIYGAEIRSKWQSLDDCGTADGKVLSKTKSSCTALRFKVPASTKKFDRVSPGSFPMGGGMYANTTNYAVSKDCGEVHYHFSAPGSIAFKERIARKNADYDGADAAYMAVLLLEKELPKNADSNYYFDPALGAENIQQIRNGADQAIAFFRHNLPDLTYRKPMIAATLVTDGGQPSNWGDAGDVLRLSLYNWPQQAKPELSERLRSFVSHELVHRFQPIGKLYAIKTPAFITEGGADFLRWSADISKHWVSNESAAQELDNALNQCLSTLAGKPWGTLQSHISGQGPTPYQCGLALHVFSLAARQTKTPALKNVNDFYSAIQDSHPVSFEQAIECGREENCQARWLPRLLGEKEAMGDVFAEFFSTTKFAKVGPANMQQLNEIQRGFVARTMQEDCGGNTSFYTSKDRIRIGEIQGCKNFKVGMEILQIEHLPLFGDSAIVEAIHTACNQRHQVVIDLKGDEAITLACTSFQIPSFYHVDIDAIVKNLGL